MLALLVALAAFAAYAPSIGYGYVALDDAEFAGKNPMVTDGLSLSALKQAFTTAPENYWAPLLWASFMLDVETFGLEPWGFHLTNVFLFSINAGLLFVFAWRLTGRAGAGAAAALLWAMHPARVESVAWITARKDVLSGLFILAGLIAYAEGRKGRLKHVTLLAWLCMAAGGMAKQVVIVMPAAMVLLDVWPLGRTDWTRIWRDGWRLAAEKWAFWLLGAALAFLPIWFHYDRGAMLDVSVGQRLAMIPIHYLFYTWKTIWPTGLMPLQADIPFRPATFAAGTGILIGTTWIFWRLRKEAPWATMGWLWFVGLLFPLIGIVWAGQERVATRFTYIPQIGLALAATLAADAWMRRKKLGAKWGVAACAVVVGASAAQSQRLLPHWEDEAAFSEAAWKYHPRHETACLLGGDWHMTRGEWLQARDAYARGAAMGNKKCMARLAWLLLWCGHAEGTELLWGEFEMASGRRLLDFAPRDGVSERSILCAVHGQIRRARGDYDEAIIALGEAVKLEPDPAAFVVAEYLRTCHEAGRPAEGAAVAARLREAKGIDIRAWSDLLPRYLQFWREGGRGLAYGYFAEYARKNPGDGLALNNMAWLVATAEPDGLVHAGMDEWAGAALAWAEKAMELGGEEIAGAWDTLGAARANAGDYAGAADAAQRGVAAAKQGGDWLLAGNIQARMEGYRAGKPWREKDRRAEKYLAKAKK